MHRRQHRPQTDKGLMGDILDGTAVVTGSKEVGFGKYVLVALTGVGMMVAGSQTDQGIAVQSGKELLVRFADGHRRVENMAVRGLAALVGRAQLLLKRGDVRRNLNAGVLNHLAHIMKQRGDGQSVRFFVHVRLRK